VKSRVNGATLVVWRTEHALLTIDELASAAGLHPELIATFVSYGLLEPDTSDPALFPASTVERLRCIVRLRRDLGVNLAGIAVILDMRAKMEALQRELERLRKRLEGRD
jgi:MerR family transcriptional regulator/heat shock protein HspR